MAVDEVGGGPAAPSAPSAFDAGLPRAADPGRLADGECPWDRYAGAPRDAWGAVLGPALVVYDQAKARAILADARFHQGIGDRMRQNPSVDPRFLARRMEGLLLRDGPDHRRLRRLAAKAFTPRAADRHRAFMREVVHGLADGVPADGACDAVATLTHAYPVLVICRVLGAPADDVELFSRLVETILNAQSGAPEFVADGLAAHEQLDDYMTELIQRRRHDPGEDLLTDLVRAEEDEARLTPGEVLNVAVSVIMAGTDTTRNQLALGLHLFADHPDQWAALGADGAPVEAAVEEVVRFAPIGHLLLRVPDADVDVDGLTVPAGTMVVLHVGAADRDPAVVADADRFDVRRVPAPPNLGFGYGPKYCLGASLARAELAEALRVLRRRFASVEHAGPTLWRKVGFVQGPVELPLRFARA